MLVDIVVDTNVLAHAENSASGRQSQSLQFVQEMRGCATQLCLDDTFTGDEASNRSAIASEYLRVLPHGSVGLALVLELAQLERLRVVSAKVDRAQNRLVNELIWDPTDRKFAKVAVNSVDHVLVSHDRGFDAAKRELARRLGVEVLDANECCPRL